MPTTVAPRHIVKIEEIYHYTCAYCRKWWSISEGHKKEVVTCPHCAATLEVQK